MPVSVEATEQDHAPASTRATLIQPPTIPADALSKLLLALGIVAAVLLSWFHVVKPAIERAASVRTGPAETALTRIPFWPRSQAR